MQALDNAAVEFEQDYLPDLQRRVAAAKARQEATKQARSCFFPPPRICVAVIALLLVARFSVVSVSAPLAACLLSVSVSMPMLMSLSVCFGSLSCVLSVCPSVSIAIYLTPFISLADASLSSSE